MPLTSKITGRRLVKLAVVIYCGVYDFGRLVACYRQADRREREREREKTANGGWRGGLTINKSSVDVPRIMD